MATGRQGFRLGVGIVGQPAVISRAEDQQQNSVLQKKLAKTPGGITFSNHS